MEIKLNIDILIDQASYIETDADKMRLVFFFIVFLKFMVMPLSVCILKVHTLTIPKW